MKRERTNTLRRSPNEIQVGDQVMILSEIQNREPMLAQIVEIKHVEINKPSTSIDIKMEFDEQSQTSNNREKAEEYQNMIILKFIVSTSGGEESQNEGKEREGSPDTIFYVHYVGTDRRLDEWVPKCRILRQATAETDALNGKQFLTRSQRRLNEAFRHVPKSFEDMDAYTRKLEMEHEQRTKVKNVEKVQVGDWEIDAWYFSPFPLSMVINKSKLYFCEFCLWYTSDQKIYSCHLFHLCKRRQPPGDRLVYEDKQRVHLAVWEVRGRQYKEYCQSLCLLSKLFLDHKTLYYDVEGFLFYVLCELDANGEAHTVGHFSKELNSLNNLACIMVLPPYQRNGYGKLLIQLSYCLSEREGIVGTPERPLSDLGKVSYRSYWWWVLIAVLDRELGSGRLEAGAISVNELSRLSGIHTLDIVDTFKALQLIKYWRGDHVVRISRKIITQIKQLNVFHAPKLLLQKSAVKWEPEVNQNNIPVRKNSCDIEKYGKI
ncbi:Histone acetyltransferase [Meloidogyne graminicola]|uniref:Histone acetyltransferase n=1 Tax=Meloidogyne graminicola TaxID=189291 RepID=A0A8S9ZZV2_9BILA|nr:Histone acetyltransferase [Meloidogyne graminicola]